MKNTVSWVLILFLTLLLLNNCLQNRTYYQESDKKQSFINQLRQIYSSGDISKWPKPILDPSNPEFSEIGHLPKIDFPADNLFSKDKALLGKTLFYDPRLSGSDQIACVSCHDPEMGWSDNKTFSSGHEKQLGVRNSMTILNVAYAKSLFWDGRAGSLEEQSKIPIEDPREMHGHIDISTGKIAKIKGYAILFEKAFGDKNVTKERIAKALATFERSNASLKSRFDLFIDGQKNILTDDEVMGLHLFRTKAQCMNCHSSGYFSNHLFENDGTSSLESPKEDLGRYLFTKKPEDAGKFKVPSLREVSKTAPWMHDGSFKSIKEILEFYNKGNPETSKNKTTVHQGIVLKSEKSDMLKLLDLTDEELAQLEAFLGTLSSQTMPASVPTLPD
ncbi:cytochrome-c peroxidase [Chryseobacterium chendengshani]|uniref:cytochrome-c peroxidase n=1 Tax=Chryseobacterium sp. LJ668 TaxID=2864040 RepID=UPI001C690405|nr:cytochrome c peroxidase [Chryseobacterium sp. LJ668]MBW8523714.1 cytochrome-c peroxidase [Chryseobacterium sp. LJ668]QYK16658.1 cytochrome-c peroxidase [Chryseobacterium sp. LJ668]